MEISNKKVLILGLGKSGIAAAKLCYRLGAVVTVNDIKDSSELNKEIQSLPSDIEFYFGHPPDSLMLIQDLIIISPGVPSDSSFVSIAKKSNIPIISEVELAFYYCKSPILAITGTNGKTTTTTLVGEVFKEAGYTTHVVGNIGLPFSNVVIDITKDDISILEVSAGQLEMTENFSPIRSVLLNLNPEHINLYKSFDNYKSIKSKVFMNLKPDDVAIINWDDINCRNLSESIIAKKIFFSMEKELQEGVFVKNNYIYIKDKLRIIKFCHCYDIKVKGILQNILATIALCVSMEIDYKIIFKVISSYKGQEHIIEYIGKYNGIDYYNDSKATNPWSTIHAINSMDNGNLILITGGKNDKNSHFDELVSICRDKVKSTIVIGETAEIILESALHTKYKNISKANSLEDAIQLARSAGAFGDTVLFSPGANSKDMFINHRQRGDQFKEIVKSIHSIAIG